MGISRNQGWSYMKFHATWVLLGLGLLSKTGYSAEKRVRIPQKDIQSLVDGMMKKGHAYKDLADLVKIGPRLAGSPGNEKAVKWAEAKLQLLGLDRVWLQSVSFPAWIRGDIEVATVSIAGADPHALTIATLGGSGPTPIGGLHASAIEVTSLKEVEELGTQVRGKIVFYNGPMDPTLSPFEAYSKASSQRTRGASFAAQHGAVGVMVRSLTTRLDDVPHTGITVYATGVRPIPAVALSTQSADFLSAALRQDPQAKVFLHVNSERGGEATSYNVIGEWKGDLVPNEVVIVGGHLDSWDLGVGAHDDGAGVVQSIDVVRGIQQTLGRLKRTVRVVLFAAEECSGNGGEVYAQWAKKQTPQEIHVAGLESDSGGFSPVGFSVDASEAMFTRMQSWRKYFAPTGATEFTHDDGGVDITPLREQTGASTFGLKPDATHYFDYHHSARDQLEAVVPTDLQRGAAAMATLVYLLAEE